MSKKLLLHICCAPDATIPWPELLNEGYDVVGYFYGSNIHPEDEYERRLEALKILSASVNGAAEIAEYAPGEWHKAADKFAAEPEGGKRCELCFSLQLEQAACYASNHGFEFMTTTLTISPHKNVALINAIGKDAAQRHGIEWIDKIWRKANGFKRSVEESKRLGLYRQNYCGCVFSIRNRAEESRQG